MVDNALFMSKEDEKFIVQEENLDKRIESIVRTIQGHVLLFYTQYESLKGVVKNSDNIRSDVEKLNVCRKNLKDIHNLCVKELEGFKRIEKDFQGENKRLYNQVLKDLDDILTELNEYLDNFDWVLKLLRTNHSSPDDLTIKHGFEEAFNRLHARYNAFIRSDENLISVLNNINRLASLN